MCLFKNIRLQTTNFRSDITELSNVRGGTSKRPFVLLVEEKLASRSVISLYGVFFFITQEWCVFKKQNRQGDFQSKPIFVNFYAYVVNL